MINGRAVGQQGRLGEIRRSLVALEEDHKRMGTCSTRGAFRHHAIGAEESSEAGEVGLEGIKQRERLVRADVIVISAEAQRVFVQVLGDVVDDFVARLAIKIGVAAVHAHREGVGHFEMRLRAGGGEIEGASRVLHTQFVDQRRSNRRG